MLLFSPQGWRFSDFIQRHPSLHACNTNLNQASLSALIALCKQNAEIMTSCFIICQSEYRGNDRGRMLAWKEPDNSNKRKRREQRELKRRVRVSPHNAGNLIQKMRNFDNAEEPLIRGTRFDKKGHLIPSSELSASSPHRNATKEPRFMNNNLFFFLNSLIRSLPYFFLNQTSKTFNKVSSFNVHTKSRKIYESMLISSFFLLKEGFFV